MNRKDDERLYHIKKVSEDGEICDSRYIEVMDSLVILRKEMDDIKNLLQQLIKLAEDYDKKR